MLQEPDNSFEQYDAEDEETPEIVRLSGWTRVLIIITVAAMIASLAWWIVFL